MQLICNRWINLRVLPQQFIHQYTEMDKNTFLLLLWYLLFLWIMEVFYFDHITGLWDIVTKTQNLKKKIKISVSFSEGRKKSNVNGSLSSAFFPLLLFCGILFNKFRNKRNHGGGNQSQMRNFQSAKLCQEPTVPLNENIQICFKI